jgi:HEAT repeat protein
MLRALALLTATAFILTALSGAAPAGDDEPKVLGRPLSEYLKILQTDELPVKRSTALRALEIIGPNHKPVVPAVRTALREDKAESVRAAAAQTLGRMAAKAKDVRDLIDPVADALQHDKSGVVREAAAAALGHMASERDLKTALPVLVRLGMPALTEALKDKHEGTRAAAAAAVGKIGPDARDALPLLLEIAKDKKADRLTREYAVRSLVRVSGPGDAATLLPTLIDALGDAGAHADVRKAAAEMLARLGKDASGAVLALGKALQDKDANVRRAVAYALEKIGPEAKDALPALQTALKDPDKFVRSQALHTIGTFGKDAASASKAVLDCLRDDQAAEVRLAAIAALADICSPDDANVIAELKKMAQEGLPSVRDAAKAALKKLMQ